MFGGFSKDSLNDLYFIDLQTAKWGLIEPRKSKKPVNRYGHTSAVYQSMLIIFGGE